MSRTLRYSLICLLIVLTPSTVTAKRRQNDGEVVITMRNGQPCFSYPMDNEIRKKKYYFYSLAVSNKRPNDSGGWAIQIANSNKKGLLEPNNPERCIKYGVITPKMEEIFTAVPLLANTPYHVRLSVSGAAEEGALVERVYRSDFCLSRNAKGEKIIVGAVWDDKTDAPRCLKPGESPKRSLWQRLLRFLSR
ncbi:MAG: hypothetical protein VB050_18020 [Geobacteraceae bacterium]|nr:hypothetical protein [Geobacteraceae bacterium]